MFLINIFILGKLLISKFKLDSTVYEEWSVKNFLESLHLAFELVKCTKMYWEFRSSIPDIWTCLLSIIISSSATLKIQTYQNMTFQIHSCKILFLQSKGVIISVVLSPAFARKFFFIDSLFVDYLAVSSLSRESLWTVLHIYEKQHSTKSLKMLNYCNYYLEYSHQSRRLDSCLSSWNYNPVIIVFRLGNNTVMRYCYYVKKILM